MSGRDEARVLAGDRGGDRGDERRRVAPEAQRAAAHEHEVGDALDHLVRRSGRRARRYPVTARRRACGVVAAASRNAPTSRTSIGCVRCSRHGGSVSTLHPLDEVDQEAKRARARADDDRGAQRDGLGQAGEQDPLDLQAAAQVTRRRPSPAARGRRGRRRGARPARCAAATKFSAAVRSSSSKPARPSPSMEWMRKYATSMPSSASSRPAPVTASPRDEVQRGGHARRVAAEAAHLVAGLRSARGRARRRSSRWRR